MTSGLSFNEDDADQSSDILQMLFVQGDQARFAASKPLVNSPGTEWSYSGGTSNIIALVMRQQFGEEKDYLRFPRERLFGPLGMRSAVLEPDSAGTFIGASLMYASARDWHDLGFCSCATAFGKGGGCFPKVGPHTH